MTWIALQKGTHCKCLEGELICFLSAVWFNGYLWYLCPNITILTVTLYSDFIAVYPLIHYHHWVWCRLYRTLWHPRCLAAASNITASICGAFTCCTHNLLWGHIFTSDVITSCCGIHWDLSLWHQQALLRVLYRHINGVKSVSAGNYLRQTGLIYILWDVLAKGFTKTLVFHPDGHCFTEHSSHYALLFRYVVAEWSSRLSRCIFRFWS